MTQPAPHRPPRDYAINVSGLSKTFGDKKVVDNISIQVPNGEIYGFLGPNGSGKTTTMRLICGLLTPDSGEGTCLGFDIQDSAPIKQRLGYMTQNFSLYGDLSVQENLEFVAGVFNVPDRVQKVRDALRQMNLEKRADQLSRTLSGGWKQRLALASCLLHDPQLLLLDEPTAGVDPRARRQFWNKIHSLAQQGMTVLVSTHYMDEAERCHQLAFISDGKILTHGTIDEVTGNSGLVSYAVTGKGLDQLATELRKLGEIDIVTRFGNALHVSGHDQKTLDQALTTYRLNREQDWRQVTPTLEDVFIELMGSSHETHED